MAKTDDIVTGDYVVPIYTDPVALIDVLSSIEGGFTSVETYKAADATSSGDSMGAAFRFLRINLQASSKSSASVSEETTGERYHSPGSLLNRLRRHLREHELLRRAPPWEAVTASDFVEFRGVFRPNAISQTLITLKRTLELMLHWPQFKRDPKKGTGPTARELSEMIDGMLNDLHASDRRLFVVEAPGAPRIVAPILVDYLRDKTLGEISHGEFRVTGKVVRRLVNPEGEAVQLFPGSSIVAMQSVMKSLVEAFKFLEDMGMKVPTRDDSEIRAPAIVVLPIGISI